MVAAVIYWSTHPWITAHLGGPKRWFSFYRFAIEAFGGTHLFLIGDPPQQFLTDKIKYQKFKKLDEILKKYPNSQLVALTGKHPEDVEVQDLKNYDHPKKDVIYIVGDDYEDIEFATLKNFKRKIDYVNIETKNKVTFLWSHICLSIVLRDRFIKLK